MSLLKVLAELQAGVAGAFLSVRLIRIYRYVVYFDMYRIFLRNALQLNANLSQIIAELQADLAG